MNFTNKISGLNFSMTTLTNYTYFKLLIFSLLCIMETYAYCKDANVASVGNFGLPGIIDLPTAGRLPDGEVVLTQQIHKSLARSGISFQALPRLGFSFRYSGHGVGGNDAYGRVNHDRSFDVHLSLLDESDFIPSISVGLRDFIGTGWYSSEYIVASKKFANLELTAGLGFGRLSGRDPFTNPLSYISSTFENREGRSYGKGGTFGTIAWFQGYASAFYGVTYKAGEKVTLSAEYTADRMGTEFYLDIKSPWNLGAEYQLNKYWSLSTQYLHGSQISLTANVKVNPGRPPFIGGMELAPVPMRLRDTKTLPSVKTDQDIIKKVLLVDEFEIHRLEINTDSVKLDVTNTKFRSISQATGRIASTLQRFTADNIKTAEISFYSSGLKIATYLVDLVQITKEQFGTIPIPKKEQSITAIDVHPPKEKKIDRHFLWGIGPYIEHRLFNPDLPLSVETGLELEGAYRLAKGLKVSATIRKSLLTNLPDNKRRSNSSLPHVHSDWPLYDIAGQSGHIYELTLSQMSNFAPNLFGRFHAGFLEPFYAGVGAEFLFKPAQSPFAVGIDIHKVKQRDYDMRFDLLDYEATVGHLSVYYDAGGMFDIEINAGRYLAGDWGVTTTISRKFGSGWEVGGYATFTDVPFDKFGEGSFDKAIYFSVPIDWIISSPNKAQRRLTLRPITRDGGANLGSARKLYRYIERSQNAHFNREFGRLWK